MDAMELARRLAGLGQAREAQDAYALAIERGADPAGQMEAAVYIFQSGGDYRISYTCFRDLYNRGHFREDTFHIMTQAFYEPNVKAQRNATRKIVSCWRNTRICSGRTFCPSRSCPSSSTLTTTAALCPSS